LLSESEELQGVPQDPQDAQMAKYSSEIYDSCITTTNCDTAYSIRYDIVENPDNCFVVFRGTVDVKNWITDLLFSLAPSHFGLGKVHAGFQDAYDILRRRSKYDAAVRRCAAHYPPIMVYITGHSLGAAMATLAVLDFHTEFPEVPVRYATFGSPRVGDAEFRSDFLAKLPSNGNRYEAVQPPHRTKGILGHFASNVSPRGDKALPGDPIPHLPPMKDVAVELADIVDPNFWITEKALNFFGVSTDNHGYRHVGVRFQLDCDKVLIVECHSMEHVYLPAVVGGNVFQV